MATPRDTRIQNGLTAFAFNIYKTVSKTGDNVFISPHSVASALMLACLGAKGNTKQQILQTLGMTSFKDSADAHDAFRQINESLTKLGTDLSGTVLSIANKLFARKDVSIVEQFIKDAAEFYQSEVDMVDFGSDPDGSRQAINAWVEDHTNNKIQDLLQEGTVTAVTTLVLANAIYFKGKWEKPFKSEKTENVDFNITASSTAKIDMMRGEFKLPHRVDETLKYSAVSIPYQNGGVSMVILLPDAIDGLDGLEQALSADNVASLCRDLRTGIKSNVDLGIPKFSMTETTDLSKILPEMGIVDLFNRSKSDLTGMTTSANATIDQVVHKAHINVDEEGTEAAAATAMMSRMMFMPMGSATFICDKPFMFTLYDNESENVLFIGRYAKP